MTAPVPSPPDTLRLPDITKDQLTTLKRRTGIKHWNTLCRWALCRSLAAGGVPAQPAPGDAIEIAWKVFAGSGGDLWWALLLTELTESGRPVEQDTAHLALRAHVARGVAYLVGDPATSDRTALARLVLATQPAGDEARRLP